jgi:hypothetical protein
MPVRKHMAFSANFSRNSCGIALCSDLLFNISPKIRQKILKSKERNLFTSVSVKYGYYCADFCDTCGRFVKFCGHLLCLILCTSEKNFESRAKFHVHVEVTCAFHCTDCYETRDLFHGTTRREVYRALSRSVQTEGRIQFTFPRNVLLSRRQI